MYKVTILNDRVTDVYEFLVLYKDTAERYVNCELTINKIRDLGQYKRFHYRSYEVRDRVDLYRENVNKVRDEIVSDTSFSVSSATSKDIRNVRVHPNINMSSLNSFKYFVDYRRKVERMEEIDTILKEEE